MVAQKTCLIETVLLRTQNMFWLKNEKNDFQLQTFILGPGIHIVFHPYNVSISIMKLHR